MKILGVGIDTARYGHMASFIGEDREPLAAPLLVKEGREGYEKLEHRLHDLCEKFPQAQLVVRIDAAGQYAANLQSFLRRLPLPIAVSVGEPKRTRDYHRSLFPKNKSDKSESWALARYAVAERPRETPATDPAFAALQEVAGRLQAQSRETTRHINQLHNLLSRTFPELEHQVSDLSAAYCLKLLIQYPTAQRIAAARPSSLQKIPHLNESKTQKIQAAARESVGCREGKVIEELVKEATLKVRESLKRKQFLQNLLIEAFRELPEMGQQFVETVGGIGEATAAVLVSKIVSIDRFETPKQLVSYFGAFPEAYSSGVHQDGTPKSPRMVMSKKGNDLVRAYLWNAACAAIRCNPDVQALYARKRAEGKRGDTALGHCMRKLLHQVFHVWKKQQPFRPHTVTATVAQQSKMPTTKKPAKKMAVGPKVVNATSRKEVTTAKNSLTKGRASENRSRLDFARLRSQASLRQMLIRLNLFDSLRGDEHQLRGPCPLHRSKSPHSKSFSVNLDKNIYQCFAPECQSKGNALDFWAAYQRLPLREAALHLAQNFHLTQTEKRNPYQTKKTGDITPDPH